MRIGSAGAYRSVPPTRDARGNDMPRTRWNDDGIWTCLPVAPQCDQRDRPPQNASRYCPDTGTSPTASEPSPMPPKNTRAILKQPASPTAPADPRFHSRPEKRHRLLQPPLICGSRIKPAPWGSKGAREIHGPSEKNPTLALALTGFWPPSGSRGRAGDEGAGDGGVGMHRSISPDPPRKTPVILKRMGRA